MQQREYSLGHTIFQSHETIEREGGAETLVILRGVGKLTFGPSARTIHYNPLPNNVDLIPHNAALTFTGDGIK